jgi:hypothetical protein
LVYKAIKKYLLYDNIKIGGLSPTIEPEKLNQFKIGWVNKKEQEGVQQSYYISMIYHWAWSQNTKYIEGNQAKYQVKSLYGDD